MGVIFLLFLTVLLAVFSLNTFYMFFQLAIFEYKKKMIVSVILEIVLITIIVLVMWFMANNFELRGLL